MKSPSEELLPISAHIKELRSLLLRVLCAFFIFFLLGLFFYEPVLQLLKEPFTQIVPLSSQNLNKSSLKTFTITNPTDSPLLYDCKECQEIGVWWEYPVEKTANGFIIPPQGRLIVAKETSPINLVFLSPAEGFFVVLKMTFWAAVLFSAPFWGYFLYLFVAPALTMEKKSTLIVFALIILACVFLGIAAALYLIIPAANQYLMWFNAGLGDNFWSFEKYIDYTLMLILACSIAFELGACLFFAVHLGFVTTEVLKQYRRHAIVGAFILAAILTPPDVLTQLLIAIPLCILYEGSILYGDLLSRSRFDIKFPSP